MAALGAVLALAGAGWPGAASRCLEDIRCYCEATHEGWFRQPANAASNVVFFLTSAYVAQRSRHMRRESATIALLFAAMLTFVGFGSMVFHGGLTTWGAVFDAVSIFATLGLVTGVTLLRAQVIGLRGLVTVTLGTTAIGALYRLFIFPVTAPLALLFLLLIGYVELRMPKRTLGRRWVAAAWLSFAAGVGLWVLSATPGAPLCYPESVWQGHAFWHAAAAVALLCLWRHVELELCLTAE